MKKTSRSTVILFGVCAVIWTVRAVVDVFNQIYNESIFLFMLDWLCALLWVAAFVGILRKYRSAQADTEKDIERQNFTDQSK